MNKDWETLLAAAESMVSQAEAESEKDQASEEAKFDEWLEQNKGDWAASANSE